MRNKLTIGLFGFGCVGKGLSDVLSETPTLNAEIKKICVKDRNKKRSLDESFFTFDANELLNDPEINVIVELIDDAEAAFNIVKSALLKGKAVVTANKKMLADHFEELYSLQQECNLPLLYEAACCASIPIIRNLEEYYDNDLLESFKGIINGSTNYILTQTALNGLTYSEALSQAQQLGYAESNPTLDTGGFDAKYKLIILAAHAFGCKLKPENVINAGIDRLGELELAYAREKGWKIKLIATAYKTFEGKLAIYVIPEFVTHESLLYNVDDVFNGVITQSVFSDQQTFIGKGAGAFPTASAVISDLSALSYDYKYEFKKIKQAGKIVHDNEVILPVLLRSDSDALLLHEISFSHIKEKYSNGNTGYLTGNIKLNVLKHILETDPVASAVLLPLNKTLSKAVEVELNSNELVSL